MVFDNVLANLDVVQSWAGIVRLDIHVKLTYLPVSKLASEHELTVLA